MFERTTFSRTTAERVSVTALGPLRLWDWASTRVARFRATRKPFTVLRNDFRALGHHRRAAHNRRSRRRARG